MKTEATIKAELEDVRRTQTVMADAETKRVLQAVEYALCWALGDRFHLINEALAIAAILKTERSPETASK